VTGTIGLEGTNYPKKAIANFTTDYYEQWSGTVTIPSDAAPGDYTISADDTDGSMASAPFIVFASRPSTATLPSATLTTPSPTASPNTSSSQVRHDHVIVFVHGINGNFRREGTDPPTEPPDYAPLMSQLKKQGYKAIPYAYYQDIGYSQSALLSSHKKPVQVASHPCTSTLKPPSAHDVAEIQRVLHEYGWPARILSKSRGATPPRAPRWRGPQPRVG